MGLTILTTDTLHHRYFVNEIRKGYECKVYLDRRPQRQPDHPGWLTEAIDRYEEIHWGDQPLEYDEGNVDKVEAEKTLIFGTRILTNVERLGETCNCHGGVLPKYRGLDTNLWARLNNDDIGVTIHQIDEGVDSGPVYKTKKMEWPGVIPLRLMNTMVALELCLEWLEGIYGVTVDSGSQFFQYPLMPWCIKRTLR
jgi:hypothetical protein